MLSLDRVYFPSADWESKVKVRLQKCVQYGSFLESLSWQKTYQQFQLK